MRKLATIETISEVLPHNNADLLELVKVRGWQVVIRKGEFKQGDLVVFCEIDSWIPNELAPFLSKGNEPREYEGVKGERLRTVRLRGEISSGLILKITDLWEIVEINGEQYINTDYSLFNYGIKLNANLSNNQ